MKNTFHRLLASILIFCTATLGMPGFAQAGIVSTDEAQSSQAVSAHRDTVNRFLARDDVRQALVTQGVDPDAARERANALTDVEVADLAGRVGTAPAGGDVLGVILTVFLILLVTDLLGWTKVFPFTRTIR
ncbi:MAG: PA2779 family protein [Burkholderiaceae bacterium]